MITEETAEIEVGTLIENRHTAIARSRTYCLRLLDDSYLPEVMALQELIYQGLSRPDMLQFFPIDFMHTHYGKKGLVMGIFVSSRLVAFRCIYFPNPDDYEWNLGIDLGFSEQQRRQVANLQMVCVHPFYRGNKLAILMNEHSIRIIKRMRRFCYLCATVSPYNYWNVNILLTCGFSIRKLQDKYEGKLRYIVCLDLDSGPNRITGKGTMVPLTDYNKQKKMIAEGLTGVAMIKLPNVRYYNREDGYRMFGIIFA